jgi:hypothetical protein
MLYVLATGLASLAALLGSQQDQGTDAGQEETIPPAQIEEVEEAIPTFIGGILDSQECRDHPDLWGCQPESQIPICERYPDWAGCIAQSRADEAGQRTETLRLYCELFGSDAICIEPASCDATDRNCVPADPLMMPDCDEGSPAAECQPSGRPDRQCEQIDLTLQEQIEALDQSDSALQEEARRHRAAEAEAALHRQRRLDDEDALQNDQDALNADRTRSRRLAMAIEMLEFTLNNPDRNVSDVYRSPDQEGPALNDFREAENMLEAARNGTASESRQRLADLRSMQEALDSVIDEREAAFEAIFRQHMRDNNFDPDWRDSWQERVSRNGVERYRLYQLQQAAQAVCN